MEFHIASSVRDENGSLTIIGRCGNEPIRAGAEFSALLRVKPRSYPKGLELARAIDDCVAIKIIVNEIEAYGKQITVLPANMTGILRCAEYSVELVPAGWILSDLYVPVTQGNILPTEHASPNVQPSSPVTS